MDAQDSRTVQIQNSSFSKSAVSAMHISSYSSAVIADSSFYLSFGSALVVSSFGQLKVHNSTFSKLTASDGAAALDLQLQRLQVWGFNFTDSTKFAIRVWAAQNVNISHSRFEADSQGALACTTPQLDIASSHCIANTADLGGALYISSVTSGRVIDCVFQDNAARPAA